MSVGGGMTMKHPLAPFPNMTHVDRLIHEVLLFGRCKVSQHAAASENVGELGMAGSGMPRVTSATTGARCHRDIHNVYVLFSIK